MAKNTLIGPCSLVVTSSRDLPVTQEITPLCPDGNFINIKTCDSTNEQVLTLIDNKRSCEYMASAGNAGARVSTISVPVTASSLL